MIFVAIALLVSTSLGVYARHRWGDQAERATARGLDLFVWFVLPPLTYLVVAHLKLDAGVGLGIGLMYVILAAIVLVAYVVATYLLRLDRPSTGATINGSLLANTGYLGIPLCAALLGHDAIAPAVAFDVTISATVCWTVGFAIGAAFGTNAGDGARQRTKAFFTRNPVLYAAALGLIAPDALAPQDYADIARTCFALILPIGFFVLGVFLMGEREDGTLDFPPRLTKPIALIIGLRIVLAPALLLAGSTIIDIPDAYLVQAAMPSGILSVIIAHIYGLNLRLAAAAVAWTTTIVVIAALVGAAAF